MSGSKSAIVTFSGRVQGVGFRFTTNEIAGKYAVVGWVRNLSNGRVQLVVKGSTNQVDGFIDEIIRNSRLSELIDGHLVEKCASEDLETVKTFEIRP